MTVILCKCIILFKQLLMLFHKKVENLLPNNYRCINVSTITITTSSTVKSNLLSIIKIYFYTIDVASITSIIVSIYLFEI